MPTTTKKKTSEEILAELRAKVGTPATANDFSTQLAYLNQASAVATSKAQQPRAAQPAPAPQRQTTIAKPGANNYITQLDMLRAKSAAAGKKQNPWEVEPLKGWVSPEPIQRNAALQVGPSARVPVEGPPKSSTEQLVQLRNQVLDAQTGITMPVQAPDRESLTGVPSVSMSGTTTGGQTLTQPSVSLELTDEQRLAALGSPREWLDRKMNPVDAISEQWDATSAYYEPTVQQARERYAAEKELSVWDDPVGFYKNTVEGFVGGLATAGQMLGDLVGQIPKPDTSATEAYLDENAALRPTGSLSATAEEATPAGLQPVPEFTDTTDYGNMPVTVTKDAMLATSAAATVMGAGLNVAASGTHAVSAVFPFMGSAMADVRYGTMRGALWLSEADDAILSTPNPNPYDKAAEYELRRAALGKPLDASEKADLYFRAEQYAQRGGLNLDNMSMYDLFGMGPYTMGQIIEANARKSGEQKVNISDIIHQATIKYKTNFSAEVVKHLDDLAGELITLQGDDATSVTRRAEIRDEIDYIYKVGSRSNLMLNPDERLKFQTEQVLTIESDVAEQKAKAMSMAVAANQKMMNARTEQDVRDAEALSYKAAELWYDADMKEKMPWQSSIDAYNFNNPWALAVLIAMPSVADSLDLVEAGLHLKPWQRRLTKTMDEFGIDEIVTAAPHAVGDTLGVLEVESIAKVVSDLESWNSNLQDVTNKIADQTRDATRTEQVRQSGHSMAMRDAYAATRPLVAVLTDINNKNDVVRIVDALLTDPQAAIRDGIKGPWTDARLAQYTENGVLRIPVGSLNEAKVQDALLTVAAIWPEFRKNSKVLGASDQLIDKQMFLHELFNATVQGGVRRYGVANEWSYAPYGTAKGVLSPLGDGRAVVKYVDIDGDVLGTSNIMLIDEARDTIKAITEQAKNNRFYVRSPMADAGTKMRGLVSPFYIYTNISNYVLNVVNQALYAFSDGVNPFSRSGGVFSRAARDEHKAALFGTTEVTGRQIAGSDTLTQFLAGQSGVVLPGSGSGPKPNALQRAFSKIQFVKPWHAAQEIAFSETIHYRNMINALNTYLRKAEGRIVDDLVGLGLSDQEARALARNVHEDVYTNGTKNINQVVNDFLEGKATGIDISEIDPNWNNYLTPQHRAKLLEGWRNATSPEQVMAVTRGVMQDVRSYWQQLVANEINVPGRVSFTQADDLDDFTTFQKWMQRGKRMGYEGADNAVKVYKQGMDALAAANKQLVDEAMKVFENDSAAVSSFISEYWYGMQRARTDIRQRLGELVSEIYEDGDANLWTEKYFPEQEKLWAEYYANGVDVAQKALENVRNKAYQAGTGWLDDLFQAAGETSVETLTGKLENLEPGLGKGSSMPEFLRTGRQIEDAATAQFFATAQQLNIRPDVMMDIVQSAMQDVSTEGARIRAWLDRTRMEIDKAKKADQTKLWDEFAIKRNAAYRELYSRYIPERWFAASQQLAAETLDLTGKTLEQAQAEAQRVAAQALMSTRLKGNLSPVERAAIENRIRQSLGEVGLPSVTKKGKPFDNAIINALRKDFKERFGYELPKNVKNLKDLTPEQLIVAEELSKLHAYDRALRQAAQQGHIRQSVLDYAEKLAPVMRLDEDQKEAISWVLEARARAWAEQTGKNADDYIAETFADPVAGGTPAQDALREYIDITTPGWRKFLDGAQATGELSVRGTTPPGMPITFFHGTGAGEYPYYDPKYDTGHNLYGRGHYKTEAYDVASGKYYPPRRETVVRMNVDGTEVVDLGATDNIVEIASPQGYQSIFQSLTMLDGRLLRETDIWKRLTEIERRKVFRAITGAAKNAIYRFDDKIWWLTDSGLPLHEWWVNGGLIDIYAGIVDDINQQMQAVDFSSGKLTPASSLFTIDDLNEISGVERLDIRGHTDSGVNTRVAAIAPDGAAVDPSALRTPLTIEPGMEFPERLQQAVYEIGDEMLAAYRDRMSGSEQDLLADKPTYIDPRINESIMERLLVEVQRDWNRIVSGDFSDMRLVNYDMAAEHLATGINDLVGEIADGLNEAILGPDVNRATKVEYSPEIFLSEEDLFDWAYGVGWDTLEEYYKDEFGKYAEDLLVDFREISQTNGPPLLKIILQDGDGPVQAMRNTNGVTSVADILNRAGYDGIKGSFTDYGRVDSGYAGPRTGAATMPLYSGAKNLFRIDQAVTPEDVMDLWRQVIEKIDEQYDFRGGRNTTAYTGAEWTSKEQAEYALQRAIENTNLPIGGVPDFGSVDPIANFARENNVGMYDILVARDPASGTYRLYAPENMSAEAIVAENVYDTLLGNIDQVSEWVEENPGLRLSDMPLFRDMARESFDADVFPRQNQISNHAVWHSINMPAKAAAKGWTHMDANDFLQMLGYDGLTHIGRGNDVGGLHRVVVDFDPANVKSVFNANPTAEPGFLKEALANGITRGAVEFTEEGKAIIRGLEQPDLVTAVHEIGHVFRRDLYRTAAENAALKADIAITEKWAGVVDGVWTVEAEEKFAKGFEKWLASGKAPIPELETVFQKLKRWMLDIYKTLTGKDRVTVSKEMRGVFERMLSSEVVTPEVEAAIKAQAQQAEDFVAGLKIGGDGKVGGAALPKVVLNADQSRKAMGMGVAPGIMYGARESLARIDDFERQANLKAADIIAGRGPVNQASATQAQQYFRNMRATYNNIISAANRYGEKMSSFAMIDYDNLNRIDEVMGLAMPYFTWYGRSFKNAAERMIFEPAFFQHLFRIEEKLARQSSAQGDPSRYEGSLPIDTPWGKWYVRLNPSRYYMLLPYAINNRFSRPGDVETPFAMFAEGMNASGLGVYWWIDAAAGAVEAYSKKAEWDTTPEAMRAGPDPVEDYWRKEGRILDFSMQTRGLQELLAYTQGVNIFTFMDLPPGLVNQVRKPWFENNVGRSINNMQAKGEITVTEATLARQLIKDFVTGNTPYPEMKRYLEENPNVTKIVNLAIQDSMMRDLIRTGSGLATGISISPFDETENEWLAAQQKQYGMRYNSETNPLGGPTAVEQFYRSPEGDLAQAANQKSSMYADVSKPDPILSLMRSDMYDRSRSASDQLQAAWRKGEVEAVNGADIYMLPVDRMAVARAAARKEAVSMYGEEWVANFEAQAGGDWYISELTAAASAEEGKAFQSLPEAATLGQQKPVSDPVTAPIADILREMSVQNYGEMNPMEREVAVTQDIITYARKMPMPNFEDYLATKDTDENWWNKYLADTEKAEAEQEDYLMAKLGMSREEARAEIERQRDIYKTPEEKEYDRVQDILTQAERYPGKPVYSDSMSKSQKKAWYQKNELWKRERTTWLAEQLGISYSEAEKILKTRADRKQELYYSDEESQSSSSGRSYYRGSSWSAYSRRSYGRSYGGRSYSSRSYGGSSGYYGRSSGGASGETDLLPSIEDYVRYVKRLTGALWNTPKPRYVRS